LHLLAQRRDDLRLEQALLFCKFQNLHCRHRCCCSLGRRLLQTNDEQREKRAGASREQRCRPSMPENACSLAPRMSNLTVPSRSMAGSTRSRQGSIATAQF
jgi:hypothetical protein